MLRQLSMSSRFHFCSASTSAAPSMSPRIRNTMKAWHIHNYGGMSELELSDDVSIPIIENPDEVLVQVKATSVNPIDIMMTDGYGATLLNAIRSCNQPRFQGIEFPLILGRDYSGVVVEKGHGVCGIRLGDEVWGTVEPYNQGAHAQYVKVKNTVIQKPKGLNACQAAAVPYAGVTAWSVLTLSAHIWEWNAPNLKVLVLGCSGGVGHLLIQILQAWKAQVVGVCGSNSMDALHELGIDSLVDYNDPHMFAKLNSLGRYDVIINAAPPGCGGDEYKQLLKPGMSSRYVTLSSPLLRYTDASGLIRGGLRAIGEALQWGPSHRWGYYVPFSQAMQALNKLTATGQLRPLVAQEFSFDQLPAAYEALQSRESAGKIVISLRVDNYCNPINPS